MLSKNPIYKRIINLFYTNRCPICGSYIRWNELICSECLPTIPYIDGNYCTKCGKDICIDHDSLFFDKIFCITKYETTAKMGIINLKKGININFAEFFSYKFADILKLEDLDEQIDIVTAVPISKKKQIRTSYNHAEVIANFIAEQINKPTDFKLIKRNNISVSQHTLKRSNRKIFADKSYDVHKNHKDIKNKTILLCDDVYTTGSTMNRCSEILMEMGAKKVICAAIATTLLTDNGENIHI